MKHEVPFYILAEDGKTPKRVKDVIEWAQAFEKQDRQVAEDFIGRVRVSTVFLGIDHDWSGIRKPVLWETMIFGKGFEYQTRANSRVAALKNHTEAIEVVKASRKK